MFESQLGEMLRAQIERHADNRQQFQDASKRVERVNERIDDLVKEQRTNTRATMGVWMTAAAGLVVEIVTRTFFH